MILYVLLAVCVGWLILSPRAANVLSSLTSTLLVQLGYTGQLNLTGTAYSPIVSSSTLKKSMSVGTALGNAAAGGGNEMVSFVQAVSASSSASVDLTSVTDIANQASSTLARIKSLWINLLSAFDDSINGTAASSVTIDGSVANALTSQSDSGWFNGATSKIDLAGGSASIPGACVAALFPSAAGVVVDSTHKIIKLTNNDGSNAAAVQVSCQAGST